MKRITAFVLSVVMLFSLTVFAYADSFDMEEVLGLEVECDIGTIKLTYINNPDGSIEFREYNNDELVLITRVTPGNDYYEYQLVDNSTQRIGRSNEWKTVALDYQYNEYNIIFAASGKTTRPLGYMHYKNTAIGQTYSISCYVDEWHLPEHKVKVVGTLGKMAEVASWLVGMLCMFAEPVNELIAAFFGCGIIEISGSTIIAVGATEVVANVTEQRIYGDCTSHTGKPQGDLGEASINIISTDSAKYPGETIYYGFTSNMWGTGALGSQMFYEVFGVAYTPTGWTGI